jgi:recombination protein RecT
MTAPLTIFESQLQPLKPQFADVLGDLMPVERLIRTVLVSCERNEKLLNCNRQSLFNAAMSAAVLGLEVDGVTGQAFLIPYKDRAQLVIGYKGYNTMGARSGLTIQGAVVREHDKFLYQLGTNGSVTHIPVLGSGHRIVGAWAVAEANNRPPVISVLSIQDIIAVKEKSPGARKPESPWNDPDIGFPAMAEKTAKRRLARSLPLNVMQLGAKLDETFEERGRGAWIDRDRRLHVEGEDMPALPGEYTERTAEELTGTSQVLSELTPPATDPPASAGLPPDGAGGPLSLEDMAREAARHGDEQFKIFWRNRSEAEKTRLGAIGPELRRLMGGT